MNPTNNNNGRRRPADSSMQRRRSGSEYPPPSSRSRAQTGSRTNSPYYEQRRAKPLPNSRYPNNTPSETPTGKPKNGKKKKKKKSPIKTAIKVFFLTVFIICFACAGAVIGAIMGIIEKAPKLELIAIEPNVYTSIIYDSDGNEIDRLHGDENREYITLDKIPKNMQHAIISIEDERFYSHNGIDIKGILRAVYSTLTGRREGASTITQQLIKNNITKVSRNTIETKVQEQYLAIKYEDELEKQLGSKKAAKDYILELYLNTIYLNHGYNGVQAASLGYFNKDASELDLAECAVLAGITNYPTKYSPRLHPEENKKRQLRILNNMLEQGYITQAEYNEASKEDVYSKISAESQKIEESGNSIHSYFVDGLFEQISNDLQEKYNMSVAQANNILYNGGLEIHSTVDMNMQKIVDDAYLNDELFPNTNYKIDVSYTISIQDSSTGKQEHFEYKQFVKNKEAADSFVAQKRQEMESKLTSTQSIVADRADYAVQPQSAMVIIDYHTGEVKALAGGRGEKLVNRGLNRATDSPRQPGSVFKVLGAFAPGIDTGTLTPATVIDDVPLDLNGYKPNNWYRNPPYRGLSTIREGVRDSMNIVAVKSMVKTGIDNCYDYLLNMGFTTLENDNHASTALGGLTKGVTQLEVTAAYGAIANGGKYYKPSLYTKVYDHNGELLLEKQTEPKQVLKETSAFLLTDMMKDVITAGTGTAAKFRDSSMPVAGKTGTTQNSRDLTFVGYTPYYVSGIWFGYDRYDDTVKNMEDLDQSSHLKVWRYIMEKVHAGYAVKDFERPDGIVTASICKESGKLASAGLCDSDPRGSTIRTEYFAAGTQPTEYCNVHKKITFCKDSEMLSNEFCPPESVYSKVGIVRPEPYSGSENIADKQYEIPAGALNGSVCNIHNSEGTSETETETTEETTENQDLPSQQTSSAPPSNDENSSFTETDDPPPNIIDGGGIVTPDPSDNTIQNTEEALETEKPTIPARPTEPENRASISIDDPL